MVHRSSQSISSGSCIHVVSALLASPVAATLVHAALVDVADCEPHLRPFAAALQRDEEALRAVSLLQGAARHAVKVDSISLLAAERERAERLLAEAADARAEAAELRAEAGARRGEADSLERDSRALLGLNVRLRHELQSAPEAPQTLATKFSHIARRATTATAALIAAVVGDGPEATSGGGPGRPRYGVFAIGSFAVVIMLLFASKAYDCMSDAQKKRSDDSAGDNELMDLDSCRGHFCCHLSNEAIGHLFLVLLMASAGLYLLWGAGALQPLIRQLLLYGFLLLVLGWAISLLVMVLIEDIHEMVETSHRMLERFSRMKRALTRAK
mmetsp:Transcript_109346/g.316050  ORF Transcript_109346/g.316050 Transcript_109346/m.316050 type:complete len:328 (+) Transcript_109346:115-1098(+)